MRESEAAGCRMEEKTKSFKMGLLLAGAAPAALKLTAQKEKGPDSRESSPFKAS